MSITAVNVASNTKNSNETCILFHNGRKICLTENVALTNQYRQFIITSTANYTSGVEDSGLDTGVIETANTKYAIYAVISQINSNNFVLVGSSISFIPPNIPSLNGRYKEGSWVYLGTVWNGDEGTASLNLVDFVQDGSVFSFRANAGGTSFGGQTRGPILADSASATSISYTYASGMGSTQIPPNINQAWVTCGAEDPGAAREFTFTISGNTVKRDTPNAGRRAGQGFGSLVEGATCASATTAVGITLILNGYVDGALALGSNP